MCLNDEEPFGQNDDIEQEEIPCDAEIGDARMNHQSHWDRVYENRPGEELGWYEDLPEPSLSLIKRSGIDLASKQLHVGVGSSKLIDQLLNEGYQDIIASDLSAVALQKLQDRLGVESEKVQWIEDDLSSPRTLPYLEPIDLWHDRAVLHFLLEDEEQENYFNLIKRLVKKGGHVIIAVFNLEGAEKCSGLPVHRYNEEMIADRLGEEFELIEAFDHTFVNPRGEDREYVYTLFKRN